MEIAVWPLYKSVYGKFGPVALLLTFSYADTVLLNASHMYDIHDNHFRLLSFQLKQNRNEKILNVQLRQTKK